MSSEILLTSKTRTLGRAFSSLLIFNLAIIKRRPFFFCLCILLIKVRNQVRIAAGISNQSSLLFSIGFGYLEQQMHLASSPNTRAAISTVHDRTKPPHCIRLYASRPQSKFPYIGTENMPQQFSSISCFIERVLIEYIGIKIA